MTKSNTKKAELFESAPQTEEQYYENQISELKQTVSLYDKQIAALKESLVDEQSKFSKIPENLFESKKLRESLREAYNQEKEQEIKDFTPEIKKNIEEQEKKRDDAQELYEKLKKERQTFEEQSDKADQLLKLLLDQNRSLKEQNHELSKDNAAINMKKDIVLQTHRQLESIADDIERYKCSIDCYNELIERRKDEDIMQRERKAAQLRKLLEELYGELFNAVKQEYLIKCGQPSSQVDYSKQLYEVATPDEKDAQAGDSCTQKEDESAGESEESEESVEIEAE